MKLTTSLITRRKCLLAAAVIVPCMLIALLLHAQTFPDASVYANDPAAMLAGYRHVEVSSVSDAIEQLTGQRMYMTHHMQPIFTTKFAGYAITVKMVKEENHDPNALSGMLKAIDQGSQGLGLRDDHSRWSGYRRHGRADGDGHVCARIFWCGDRWSGA